MANPTKLGRKQHLSSYISNPKCLILYLTCLSKEYQCSWLPIVNNTEKLPHNSSPFSPSLSHSEQLVCQNQQESTCIPFCHLDSSGSPSLRTLTRSVYGWSSVSAEKNVSSNQNCWRKKPFTVLESQFEAHLLY